MSRTSDFHAISSCLAYRCTFSTVIRKNFTSVSSFFEEPDSRAQCVALEENVKEFGLTYFGMSDRRQGMLGVFDKRGFPHLKF